MDQRKTHQLLIKLTATAMMTAIVFVGNFLRVTMPVPLGGVTSFTLANILCALSGILLGPLHGFLAAGLGSFFFDLTGIWAKEALITLCTKPEGEVRSAARSNYLRGNRVYGGLFYQDLFL